MARLITGDTSKGDEAPTSVGIPVAYAPQ